jgi:hypothetical protein
MASREERFKPQIEKCIIDKQFEDGRTFAKRDMPLGEDAARWLEDNFKIKTDRKFRIILVEDFAEYKVFIQVPNGKSDYDFDVWYAKFTNGKLSEVSFPKHDYMFDWFRKIRETGEDVLAAVERMIRNRERPESIASRFRTEIGEELHKFLATLKWICLQEEVNYPPPTNMGSKYTLAAYVLLNYGFEPFELRRLLRFKIY